jgi:hypothetical protein
MQNISRRSLAAALAAVPLATGAASATLAVAEAASPRMAILREQHAAAHAERVRLQALIENEETEKLWDDAVELEASLARQILLEPSLCVADFGVKVGAWEMTIFDPGWQDGDTRDPGPWMEFATLHLFKDARGLLGV